jgi:hypothetical protein
MSLRSASFRTNTPSNLVFHPEYISPQVFGKIFKVGSLVQPIIDSHTFPQSVKNTVWDKTVNWNSPTKFNLENSIIAIVKRFFSPSFHVLYFPKQEEIMLYFKSHPSTAAYFGEEREEILSAVAARFSHQINTSNDVSKGLVEIVYEFEKFQYSLKKWDTMIASIITALKDCAAEYEMKKGS